MIMTNNGTDSSENEDTSSSSSSKDSTTSVDEYSADSDNDSYNKPVKVISKNVINYNKLKTTNDSVEMNSNNTTLQINTNTEDKQIVHKIGLNSPELLQHSNNNDSAGESTGPILVFDAYGNLSMVNKPEEESVDSVVSTIPEEIHSTVSDENKSYIPPLNNISLKRNNGSHKKTKTKVQESPNNIPLSDSELKQAFKEEFNSSATSRYGRARKRKTADGFLFGTLNFNELRRLEGNSPKKLKTDENDKFSAELSGEEEPITQNDSSNEENTIVEEKKSIKKSSKKENTHTINKKLDFDDENEMQNEKKPKVSSPLLDVNDKNGEISPKKSISIEVKERNERLERRKRLSLRRESIDNSQNDSDSEDLNTAKVKLRKRKSSISNDVPTKEKDKKPSEVVESSEQDANLLSPTTTKYGRQSKKFVPLDIYQEDTMRKEVKRKLKEENSSSDTNEVKSSPIKFKKELDEDMPCEFLLGDLVWVSMKTYPIWPALLRNHPKEKQYSRIYTIRSSHNRQYHAQFYNDNNLTSWVHSQNLLPFEGYEALKSYVNSKKEEASKDKKKIKSMAILDTVKHIEGSKYGSTHDKWKGAVAEAEEAFKKPREKRLEVPLSSEEESDDDYEPKEKYIKKNKIRGRPRKDPIETSEEPKRDLRAANKKEKDKTIDKYFKKKDIVDKENSTLSDDETKIKIRRKYKRSSIKVTNKGSCSSDTETSSVDSNITSLSSASSLSSKKCLKQDDNERGTYRIVKKEKICYKCEEAVPRGSEDLVKCKGLCFGYFHAKCVGLDSIPTEFKCEECVENKHPCFICHTTEGSTVRCSISGCGKFYHEDCVKKWPQVYKMRNEKLVCPRHICHMCAASSDDMADPVARTAPFTRCLRCPTTYHTGEKCIAAGSEEITIHNHICTKHIKQSKNSNYHYNVNWCFCCSKGGSLILCDQCPAAFHSDCMDITAPEGGYVCDDCENGKFPVYGDVVWVKLGAYRWWPSEVLHPRHIPDNIENLQHQQGMFCVHFLGSNDYYWVTRGRTFQYHEGDQGATASYSTKTLEKRFAQALSEAAELYHTQRTKKDQHDAARSGKGNLKPPPFVKIDTNRPVGNVKLGKLDLASVNKCDCDPYAENPCSEDNKCLNRMLMFECIREVCPAGARCCNQRFQKRQYPDVIYSKAEGRGWGLKTNQDIKKGEFVIEYVGELVDEDEFRNRLDKMQQIKEENYYFLTIDCTLMIDAGPKGNLARFMNHSCDPNCQTQKWTVGADTRVGLFALQDIPSGSELTFNYNLECVGTEKKKCQCGSYNCSGFIGSKVKPPEKREKNERAKKKKKRRPQKNSEDECYRCGVAGDLILCDNSSCPKGYHLECLGLEKLPKGKWVCPWHHCDECGLKATILCDYCPNSFCRNHASGKIQIISGVGNICQEHNGEDGEAESEGNDSSESEESRKSEEPS